MSVFGLILVRRSLRIQSECGKIRTWITPNMDIFHAVTVSYYNQLKYHQMFLSVKSELGLKTVHIRSYSGPYFSAFGLNADQNNSEYGHFLHSVIEQDGKTLWWKNLKWVKQKSKKTTRKNPNKLFQIHHKRETKALN